MIPLSRKKGRDDMIRISLAAARVNKNLSQRKMAEKLGVHEMTYAAWERNPEKIKVEMAEKISGITGIPTENLVFLANPVENGGE